MAKEAKDGTYSKTLVSKCHTQLEPSQKRLIICEISPTQECLHWLKYNKYLPNETFKALITRSSPNQTKKGKRGKDTI